jgi:hypothetical protein
MSVGAASRSVAVWVLNPKTNGITIIMENTNTHPHIVRSKFYDDHSPVVEIFAIF